MWKVTIEGRYGGEPSVYWVEANTATDAERIARNQLNRRYLADGEPLPEPTAATVLDADDDAAVDPDEWWPRPQIIKGIRVHAFSSTATGYDQTLYRNDIHDGDVLFVPTERVAGFMMQAWPIAVSVNNGEFHRYTADDLLIDGIDYTANVAVAHTLLGGSAYSVTIAGPQPPDGQAPGVWVVQGLTEAEALAAHRAATGAPAGHDLTALNPHGEPVYTVVSVTAGIPGRGQGAFNDARPGADHSGQHDCLAIEDLRHRVQTLIEHRAQPGRHASVSTADTHNDQYRVPDDVLTAEAVAIVELLGAIFERGLS
ncbi:MAG: hypothetical protein QOE61_2203 [Micromonosporaceae bacterium]|nr:hypothetical protein [Micromonosporaceae bacterium]